MQPASDAPAEKPIPLWLAISVLAAILVGGVAFVWKYVRRPPNATRITMPALANPRVAGSTQAADERTKAAVLAAAAESELPDGAHPRGKDDVLFKSGDIYMRVTPRDNADPAYTFGYFTLAETEWDHGYLTQGVRRILADEDYAKELGITAEQVKKLEALPEPPASKWPEKDRKRFVDSYQGWARAAEPDRIKATEEIVRSLKEYGEKRRWGDQQLMAARIGRIKTILTERQLKNVNPIPRWELKETTTPAKP
jgi:hypothetical protein